MSDLSPLPYAESTTPKVRPTRHSYWVGPAFAMFAVEVIFRASLIAYAHYRSPTYPWQRFYRNVGDPRFFLRIDQGLFLIGVLFALAALIHPYRRRSLAIFALVAHTLVGYGQADLFAGLLFPALNRIHY